MASDGLIVSFNIGGRLFTTVRDTLLKEPNSRLALIARNLLGTPRDPVTGAYIIDRDPKHFQLILNWLRDGWCLLPKLAEERRELLQEARFYQLGTFEGWLRTQEILQPDQSPPSARERLESPRLRLRPNSHSQVPYVPPYTPIAASPSSPTRSVFRPISATIRPASAWLPSGPPPATTSFASTANYPSPGFRLSSYYYNSGAAAGRMSPTGRVSPGRMSATPGRSPAGRTSSPLGRTSPTQFSHAGVALGRMGSTSAWGPENITGGNGGAGGAYTSNTGTSRSNSIAALREAFLAATAPQRPAPHVAPYSLAPTADESNSWTSKYLRGNESLRDLVNTLLELAFLVPHRSLHIGKSRINISVPCTHSHESSLVGSREEQMRNKLMDIRVHGGQGWTFELTLRPSSDASLWDKYGGVAAGVQDNWFVLGAILKDQCGVVLEEDTASRPNCVACRRTCLAINLNKMF